MALDLCSQLTLVLDEERVLHRILEIFSTLFAPQKTYFWVMEQDRLVKTLVYPEYASVPSAAPGPAWVAEFPHQPEIQPDATWILPDIRPTGFRLRIPYKEETIGIIEVSGLAFPEHSERYLSLALAIAGVCGLAVANARTHHRLEAALRDLRLENARSSKLSDDLKIANDQLEERVRQRTAELADANRDLIQEVARRKEAEERITADLKEKEVLLREVHHRVKNNLQIIMSLLSLQSRKFPDAALSMALRESQNRIKVMSYVHEKLFASEDLGRVPLDGYFRFLVNNLLTLYQVPPNALRLTLDAGDVAVDINTAIPLGLVINELVSNSIRHAFPPGTPGELGISVREDPDGSLHIMVRDNGKGLPESFDPERAGTLGLTLAYGLIDQLDGTIVPVYNGGQQFVIDIIRKTNDGSTGGTYNPV
jgi:two-component sensor histidine kinase